MSALRLPAPLFILVLLFASSGCDATEEEDDCLAFGTCDVDERLDLRLIEHSTRTPANVSLLFKVDTEEGVPVANLTPANFEIYENEDLISRYESQQSILPKSGRFRYSIALLLDLSGSIVASENLPALKQAAKSFVEALMFDEDDPRYGEVEMGIWWFDGRAEVDSLVGFSHSPSLLTGRIDDVNESITVDNSTNLHGAVIQGVDITTRRLAVVGHRDVITAGSVVLFTDGTDQANRVSRKAALRAVAEAEESVSVHTIGLGGEIDEPTLREIGANGFVSAGNLEDLVPKFRELADLVRAEANSYYLVEYCSPKRAGKNDLTLKVTHNELVGLLSARFSAEEFSPGCTVTDPFFGKTGSTTWQGGE